MSTTRRDRRPVRTGTGAFAVAAMLLLAACGSSDSSGSGGSVTPSEEPPGTASTDLQIVVDDGSGATQTWKLTCDPAGGDHPDPAAACEALATSGEKSLPPVPKDTMCTQIFGGPEKATVTGTWKGEQVSSTFSRNNGCEINRWNALAPLFGSSPSPTS